MKKDEVIRSPDTLREDRIPPAKESQRDGRSYIAEQYLT